MDTLTDVLTNFNAFTNVSIVNSQNTRTPTRQDRISTRSRTIVRAKAGVIGLTRGLAREFAQYGITANAICPGVVDTDIRVGSTPENEVKLAEAVPMKRQCKPEEIAALYVWLSSADAGYITGTTQNINGGAYIA